MRTLIITTGNGRYLTKVWLPTLRLRGEYFGDILMLDYDFTPDILEILEKDKNIILKRTKQIYDIIPSDRFRAFYEVLGDLYKNYDVIMSIDADVEFFKPIQPLFDAAQEKIRYVLEWGFNRQAWKPIDTIPNAEEYWNKIKDKRAANVGMFVGPAKLVYETIKFIAENLKYKSIWSYDQRLFNIVIYCSDIPTEPISEGWNFTRKGYLIIGRIIDPILDEEIAILHKRNV